MCMARLYIKIKLVTKSRKKDPYLRLPVPLVAVIRIDARHTHSLESADALRLLDGTASTRETFIGYFNDGMGIGEARKLHESKLCVQENGLMLLANRAINPLARTVQHWHCVWRANKLRGWSHRPTGQTRGEGSPLCSPRYSEDYVPLTAYSLE
ncbi:hypothetical protein HPB48_009182 [Haemaphysalis longicornis]|uniref:Uncharacterized protein n=1 Tax=Haemaphysalis longicornis TaxID=44386 RepID=A0A9J6GRV3_HAELO|nr:hypothetical protein HPB48_009182 [Haemaphysalis longicornis]